ALPILSTTTTASNPTGKTRFPLWLSPCGNLLFSPQLTKKTLSSKKKNTFNFVDITSVGRFYQVLVFNNSSISSLDTDKLLIFASSQPEKSFSISSVHRPSI